MSHNHKKLERLMLFHEVAKQLSFTQAAIKLGISKSHLSAQIRQLELDMNTPLLVRSTRSVKLTEQGKEIAKGTHNIHASLLNIERSVLSGHDEVAGTIKFTAPRLFTECYLLKICQAFKAQYSGVSFSIDCSYTSHDLNQSDFDLAFRATRTPPENMIAKALLPYKTSCYASRKYIDNYGQPLQVTDLKAHQCLAGQDQQQWEFKDGSIDIAGWMQINDNGLLKQLALAGEGIIKVPEYFVKKEVALGELLPVLQHQSLQERAIFMVYPQVIFQSKKIKTFIEYVFNELKNIELSEKD